MTRKTKRTLWISLAAFVLIVGGAVAYYFGSILNQLDGLQKKGEDSPFANIENVEKVKTPDPPKWEGTETVNILVMGVDARGLKKGEVPRSDSMMVVSLDPLTKKINLFSILRDTYINIDGYGKDRINTAITHGPNVAMEAASDLLGIPVQYYVYTDFQGFIKLVDAVGGVDFDVEKDMHYVSKADNNEYDIDLKKGYQHLDGKTALMYVRFRHDAMSDFARSERQRELLKAVTAKMQSTTTIAKLPSILEQVSPYVDTNLTLSDMWKLGGLGYQSSMNGSEQVPPMNLLKEERTPGGAQVLSVTSEEKLKQHVQDIIHPPAKTEDEKAKEDKTASGNEKNTQQPAE
ncbi:transcriptional attenuator, LytR family [Paenibacillus polysaccharolyticus]|uniref:Transcriptional attenuator, LytR family n=1 Tax=Paenibacillus polysaccharolyticus TaxID=582692 RepID=A0A1G5LEB8_9BACL|nr:MULTISPECIES: LCP family protein [Paenibacillus]SCZ10811.1 transcriptional attenuator, LytR family [Paenibacillus polysaccharolyticus]